MPEQYTNLMPSERKHTLLREYYLRLSVVTLWFIAFLAVVAGVLMLPTYKYLSQSSGAKEAQLQSVEAKAAANNQASLTTRLTALSHSATTLKQLGNTATASAIVRTALEVPRNGISLSGFTYTPINGKTPGTLAITGTAATRDALRNYQIALQSAAFAKSADLPVSAYAKDSNIPFSIIIALAP